MPDAVALARELAESGSLLSAALSDPGAELPNSIPAGTSRVAVKPVEIRGERRYQFEYRHGAKATHKNLPPQEASAHLAALLTAFRQAVLRSPDADHLFVRRKDRTSVRTCPPTAAPAPAAHDRPKERMIPDGVPCDFLIRLGVMTESGKVIASRYDKFRQVNRFLEMVADVADRLDSSQPITVVDFGSGRGYLTFGLYHYLRRIRGLGANVHGVEARADLVDECAGIARDLAMEGLSFHEGGIRSYDPADRADMVVALHACDTATDDALARAVDWQARVILAAPCCQHELRDQVRNDRMRPLLKHGILRERLAALVTDALRAQWLELSGYSVQVLEFVESEHTPKNLLIRAVRQDHMPDSARREAEYASFRDFWSAHPALDRVGDSGA